jgi:two-component system, LytTR family, sensor histidine kinase AlgZ
MMESSRATEPKTQWEQAKYFLRHAGYMLLGCFLIGLVIFWFRENHSLRSFFWNMVYSVGYGGTIGILMRFVMPRVAPIFWRWPAWAKWPALYATMLGLTAGGCLLALLILSSIGVSPWSYFWPSYVFGLRIAVVICLIVGTASIAYERLQFRLEKTALKLRTKELERQKALNAATAARLASLESRIHPHFLFNALNSISSLIPEDPVRAERLVEQMAALLRFSLDSNQMGLVPLEREMKIVADYLDIEQARYGDRLSFTISVPAEFGHFQVPPLAVQTLVENSVKHAVAPRREGGVVEVTARPAGDRLLIEVVDDRTLVSLLVPQPAGQTLEQV